MQLLGVMMMIFLTVVWGSFDWHHASDDDQD